MNARWREVLWPEAAIWLALIVLVGATVVLAFSPLGWGVTAVNLGIAVLMALLVALFFMHLRSTSSLNRLSAIVGVLWLCVLIVLTMADFLTR